MASPAAWLRGAGVWVTCLDLSRQALGEAPVHAADFIGFYVPMHTATGLAADVLPAVRRLNPRARLCFYGLYAPVNEGFLRKLGADTVLGGEFEEGLRGAVERVRSGGGALTPSLSRSFRSAGRPSSCRSVRAFRRSAVTRA